MVLNVAAYRFVAVDDPSALASQLRSWAAIGETDELRGTVLIASEGINLFLAGAECAIDGFLGRLCTDPRFAALRVKRSSSATQPFARLKIKVRREIIAFRRHGASPLEARAPTVEPAELARWIAQGHDDTGRPLVLLDTRNREEVAHGSFTGALTLPIDNFSALPAALASHRDALKNATVVSFCTGGIRCEKAALWLRNDGMDNVLQLEGGILGYFEQVGDFGYQGRCFVFDARVSLDAQLQPLVDTFAPAKTVAAVVAGEQT